MHHQLRLKYVIPPSIHPSIQPSHPPCLLNLTLHLSRCPFLFCSFHWVLPFRGGHRLTLLILSYSYSHPNPNPCTLHRVIPSRSVRRLTFSLSHPYSHPNPKPCTIHRVLSSRDSFPWRSPTNLNSHS
jgi:hypothetical protein